MVGVVCVFLFLSFFYWDLFFKLDVSFFDFLLIIFYLIVVWNMLQFIFFYIQILKVNYSDIYLNLYGKQIIEKILFALRISHAKLKILVIIIKKTKNVGFSIQQKQHVKEYKKFFIPQWYRHMTRVEVVLENISHD